MGRINVSVNGHFTGNTTVHEYKAPTDESIKLYKELREKAVKDVIATVHLENTVLNGVGVYYQFGMDSYGLIQHNKTFGALSENVSFSPAFDTNLYLRFKINGQEMGVKQLVSHEDMLKIARAKSSEKGFGEHFAETLINLYSRYIAVDLLKKSIDIFK